MVDTPIEKDRLDPHPDRGFDKRIIWGLIAAAVVFVILFLFLSGMVFSPDNPSGAGHSSQQTTGTQTH